MYKRKGINDHMSFIYYDVNANNCRKVSKRMTSWNYDLFMNVDAILSHMRPQKGNAYLECFYPHKYNFVYSCAFLFV